MVEQVANHSQKEQGFMCIEHEKSARSRSFRRGKRSMPPPSVSWREPWVGAFHFLRFLHRLVELLGNELDAVLLDTVLVGPLFGLQIPLDGEQRTFFQQLERCAAALAPGFHVNESGYAVGGVVLSFLAVGAIGKRATSLLVNVRISASFATKPVMMKEFSTCFMTVSFLEVEQLIFTDARRYCRHRAAPRAARQIRNIL